jgi:hypothetical protein
MMTGRPKLIDLLNSTQMVFHYRNAHHLVLHLSYHSNEQFQSSSLSSAVRRKATRSRRLP